MTRSRRSLTLVTLALWACGSDIQAPVPGPPATLRSTSGDYQRVEPGQTLAPLVVTVTDSANVPVPRVPITWAFARGTGRLDPPTGRTDVGGKATTTVYLSPTAQDAQVLVTARITTDTALSADFLVLVGNAGFGPRIDTLQVTVRDNYFDPGSVSIAAGGTVIWTLGGSNPHWVGFPFGRSGPAIRVLSGDPLDTPKGQYVATFNDPGDYLYECWLPAAWRGAHPRHEGWVHVH